MEKNILPIFILGCLFLVLPGVMIAGNTLDKAGNPTATSVTAYSLRRLSTAYTGNAILVRRSSDNTTQDIGFTTAGDLDTAALKTFVGSGNGYISIWYDQSGNAINATQTTNANQPVIVTSGTVNRDNGRPAIYTSGTGYLSYSGMTQFGGGYQASRMDICRSRNGSTQAIIAGLGTYQLDMSLQSNTQVWSLVNSGSVWVQGTAVNNNALMAVNSIRDNAASKLYINGALSATNSNSIGTFGSSIAGYIGIRFDGGGSGNLGAFSESILFSSALSASDRQAIDSNQINYYSLTNPLDKTGTPAARPTSAYSLRQLGSTYVGKAVQVRRSSDNTTQDIGFTAAGDLDTAALKTFVGSGNGYVSIWYDQSGNGINATQTTNTSQPLIVSSGVVNRDNGRPAIYTSGTGYLVYSGMTQFSGGYQASRMDVGRSRNGNAQAIIAGLGTYQLDWSPLTDSTMWVLVNSGSILVNASVPHTNTLMAVNAIRNNAASKLYVNGLLKGTNSTSIGAFGSSIAGYIGVRFDGAGSSGNLGSFSESILFNSVLSDADRNAIDSSQMTYYSLVNPLDKAGSPSAKPVTAYSLRQLGSNYAGKAIQVRRGSDNTTQDIGFTSAGDLDTTALKTFAGSGNAYISIWYDQSGNGVNAIQATNASQPIIVNAGAVYRDNGRPVIYTNANGYLVYSGLNQFNGSYQASRMDVARSRNGSSQAIIAGLGTYQLDCSTLTDTTMWILVNSGSVLVNGTVTSTNLPMAICAIRNNGASKLYINNTLKGTNSASISAFGSSIAGYIGIRFDGAGGSGSPGAFSESILFNTVLSDADRQAVDSNQISYYSLVTPPNPLDKLGSPTARPVTAFSMRKLGSNYVGKAIQVRRSSDNTTQDIGFTVSGDLDTATLRTFVGSGNGYVSIWYDQSGNGINATQTTTANQPLIVTNGAINFDNGRPAIYTSGTGYLSYSGMSQFSGGYQASRMDVVRSRNGSTQAILEGLGSYQLDLSTLTDTTMWVLVNSGSILVNGSTPSTNALMVVNAIRNTNASNLYVNGVLKGNNSSGIGGFGSSIAGYIGIRFDGAGAAGNLGAFSETILFNKVLSDADRQLIDSNQMQYYTITNALDKVGTMSANPAAAFSLRQLSSGYSGNAIQVRRSSDNTLMDIGFTSAGDLDTAALKTFVGSGNGYISTWYDQSGQKRNKTQSSFSLQPLIINAGTLYRQAGKPVIYFPLVAGSGLAGAAPDYLANGDISVILTAWSNSSSGAARRAVQGKTQNWYFGPYNNHNAWYGGGYIVNDSVNPWRTSGEIFTVIEPANGANLMYRSGQEQLNVSNGYKVLPGSISVSAAGANNEPMDGYISELLEFNSALSNDDRSAAEQSSGGYSAIRTQSNNMEGAWLTAIQPTEVFALRQINTGYGGPLVRISTGSNYYDVYPDDDGNLSMSSPISTAYTVYNADTTGVTYSVLSDVIAPSANATVAIWYDQSGRGWNALQSNTSNQPAIIQSGSFITAPGNARPGLLFSQANKTFLSGDVSEINGMANVTVNAVFYQNTANRQVLFGKEKVWNLTLGLDSINGAGAFNTSRNGTVWCDSATRFVGIGLPSLNKVNSIVSQYGQAGQTVFGNGIPLGSLNATQPSLGSTGQAFQISGYGGAAGSNYFDGYIQEIILTDSVLGSEDLRLLTGNQHIYFNTKAYTTWTGAGGQAWTNACSWSGGLVPVAHENVFIPAGSSGQPIISSAVASPDTVIVAPGATVAIGTGGTFIDTSSKVILLASPSAMGYVINTAGASLGTVTVQKWFTGQQGFRVLAYPFTGNQTNFLSAAASANGFNILLNSGSGTTSPSSSTPAIPSSSISDAQIFSANAWTNMVNGSSSANIPYALYYRGLLSAIDTMTNNHGPSSFALTVRGTTNSGTNVSVPAANSTTAFTVAGNPFTAPVTTLAMTGDATGNTSYYVWEIPTGSTDSARRADAGQWVPYLQSNKLLPVMTAMAFKQATATATIIVPTSAMSTSGTLHMQVASVETGHHTAAQDDVSLQYLELDVTEKGDYRDRLFLRLDHNGSGKGTDQADMEKLFNSNLNAYTLADDRAKLAVDFRKEIVQPIPVGIRASKPGHYQFVVNHNDLFNGSELYLIDNKLQTKTQLKEGAFYDFSISEKSVDESRFQIFYKSESQNQPVNGFAAVLLGNAVDRNEGIRVALTNTDNGKVSVELFNMQGVRLATTYAQDGIVTLPASDLAAGMYVVKCTKGSKSILLKLVVK
jgi:hypothetical protein